MVVQDLMIMRLGGSLALPHNASGRLGGSLALPNFQWPFLIVNSYRFCEDCMCYATKFEESVLSDYRFLFSDGQFSVASKFTRGSAMAVHNTDIPPMELLVVDGKRGRFQ